MQATSQEQGKSHDHLPAGNNGASRLYVPQIRGRASALLGNPLPARWQGAHAGHTPAIGISRFDFMRLSDGALRRQRRAVRLEARL